MPDREEGKRAPNFYFSSVNFSKMEVTENGQKCDNDSEGLCHGPTSSVSLLCQDGGWEIFIKGDKVTWVFGNPEW